MQMPQLPLDQLPELRRRQVSQSHLFLLLDDSCYETADQTSVEVGPPRPRIQGRVGVFLNAGVLLCCEFSLVCPRLWKAGEMAYLEAHEVTVAQTCRSLHGASGIACVDGFAARHCGGGGCDLV